MDQPDYVLAETRIESRDGARWVSGLCPSCWERVAIHAPARGTTALVHCSNGHLLRVADQTSEGLRTYEQGSSSRLQPQASCPKARAAS